MGAAIHPQLLSPADLDALMFGDYGGEDEDSIIDFIQDEAGRARRMFKAGEVKAAHDALLAIHKKIDDLLTP